MKQVSKKEKLMNTKDVAKVLGVSKTDTVLNNARKCLPNKKITNGKTTYWNEQEVTILLEQLKHNNSNQNHLPSTLEGISTTLSPALKIRQAMLLMQEGYEEELNNLRLQKKQLEKQNDSLQIELSQSKE